MTIFDTALRAAAQFALATAAFAAQADDFSFGGNLTLNTDLVAIDFGVISASGPVKLWTDSWQGGLNFDPNAALWKKTGADYALVDTNDDNDAVGAGQGFFDTGFSLASLAVGSYRLTIGVSPNVPLGTLLSQGFGFDPAYGSIAVAPIASWNQPSYDPNKNDQKGTRWHVNLSGVQGASLVSAVPEPSSAWLMVLGLGVFAVARLRGAKR